MRELAMIKNKTFLLAIAVAATVAVGASDGPYANTTALDFGVSNWRGYSG